MEYKQVVSSFLQFDKQVLLLRRSDKVKTNRGKWSAVSGYLEGTERPLTRAITEVHEEVGLATEQFDLVRVGEPLRALDQETNTVWVVHPFLFQARSKAVRLDWENAEYKWLEPEEIESCDTVPKLRETLDRVQYDLDGEPASLTGIIGKVKLLEQDRVHGASFLGQQAAALLSEAAQVSDAKDGQALFSHLLLVTLRLRRTQPAMAMVWNLTGRLLHVIAQKNRGMQMEEVRKLTQREAERILAEAREESENASRTAAQILPRDGSVLTHSYSSAVLRTLELGFKGGRRLHVYATESFPGFEGKQLGKELIAWRVPVTLIADTAVSSVIRNSNMVLVGADSVLTDGSLIHKAGTSEIATAAKKHGIPFYSVCETAKFSVRDFLGERPEIPSTLFDATPSDSIAAYITERGPIDPAKVESVLKDLQADIYP